MSCTTLYGLTLNFNKKDSKDNPTTVVTAIASKKEITEPAAINVEIYPNPVEDVVRVTGLEGVHTVKIMNALGQVVVSVKGTSTELELDLNGKPVGIYLIKIEMLGKSITRKLIKK